MPNDLDSFAGPVPVAAASPSSIRVVGLDLSLTGTGVAVLDEGGIHTSLITSKGVKAASLHDRARRLSKLTSAIVNLIPERALVIIEQPAYSQTAGSHHDRSGLWWLVVDTIASFQTVVEISPGTLKKYATGKGNAGKDEMLAAAIRRYPNVEAVNNNVADAMHLLAMGARHVGQPLEADTVKILEAMAVPRWDA